MTRRVTTAGGNYDSAATWEGGLIPEPGDIAEIRHGVTFNVDPDGVDVELYATSGLLLGGRHVTIRNGHLIGKAGGHVAGDQANATFTFQSGALTVEKDIIVDGTSLLIRGSSSVPIVCRDYIKTFNGGGFSRMYGNFTCRDIRADAGTAMSINGLTQLSCQRVYGTQGVAISINPSVLFYADIEEIIAHTTTAWMPLIVQSGDGNPNSVVRARKVVTGPYGQWPIQGPFFLWDDPLNTVEMRLGPYDETKVLCDPVTLGNPPDESDVRHQVVFAFGNREGTCHVPPPDATGTGVPVDHTLGTAILTKQNVQTAVFGDGIRRINLSATFGGSGVPGVAFQIDGSVVRTSSSSDGLAILHVDPNLEYTIRVIPPVGFASVADLVIPVLGEDVNLNVVLTLSLPTIIPPAGTCALTVRVADQGGASLVGVPVWAKFPAGYSVKAEALNLNTQTSKNTDPAGLATLILLRDQPYDLSAKRPDGGQVTLRIRTPDTDQATLGQVLQV